MPDAFDPYHRWLGIPPKHQPPDHYRLLGIERFEDDPEVIRDAADRQMGHVRHYALGEHSELSQQVLNELGAARACLLNEASKAEYDRGLRGRLAAAQAEQSAPERGLRRPATIAVEVSPVAPTERVSIYGDRLLGAAKRLSQSPVCLAIASFVGVVLVALLVVFVLDVGHGGRITRDASQLEKDQANGKTPKIDEDPTEPEAPEAKEKLPVLSVVPIPPQTARQGERVELTVQLRQPDQFRDNLHFRLDVSPPPGARIDPRTGVFVWDVPEEEPPNDYRFRVHAALADQPAVSATVDFSVKVEIRARPPVVSEIGHLSIEVGRELKFTVPVTDPGYPRSPLRYSLVSAMEGAVITPDSGQFTWTPTEEQAGQEHHVTVRVASEAPGVPAIETSFTVTVRETERFTRADYAQHVMRLRNKLPPKDFTVVIQHPFVVIGDETPEMVKRRSEGTVKWAADKLKEAYFAKDPAEILDIWLFKDDASYRKHTKEIFNYEPDTPYGYFSSSDKALVMNIHTGGGTLVREIVHAFVAANFPACPAWFNEGLAALYEQSGERGGKIAGYTNWRLDGLQKAIRARRVPSFKTLCSTTNRQFHQVDTPQFYQEDTWIYYAQARYLCYWLQEHGLLRKFYHQFHTNYKKDPTGYEMLKAVLGRDEEGMDKFKKEWESDVLKLTFP